MVLDSDSIQQAIKHHDQYQVEIKLDYSLIAGEQTRYKVETFIFAPYTLGISSESYSRSNFYRDIQNYIRLKTPVMHLKEFTESKISPLLVIKQFIQESNWIQKPSAIQLLNNQFKLLGVMLNSSLREHLAHISDKIEETPSSDQVLILVDSLIETIMHETARIAEHYRELYLAVDQPLVPAEVVNGYQLTDESISILIEEGLIDLFEIVEDLLRESGRPQSLAKLSERVEEETAYRKEKGYSSILDDTGDNEAYLYRASILKKYAASILFLQIERKRDGVQLMHLGNAIAAGLAMIFATVVAFYFQARFGNFTMPLFIALVIGYMFKDRIKEIGRTVVARYLNTFLYDQQITIRSQEGVKLGYLKEKFDFVTESELPRLVLQKRNRDQFSKLDNDGRDENIIRHAKEIVLYANAFEKILGDTVQITGINDILRYDIRAYLNKMAEPIQLRNYLENEKLQKIACHKVYHMNIVSRYRTTRPEKSKWHDRIRLILDQNGIKRIEKEF